MSALTLSEKIFAALAGPALLAAQDAVNNFTRAKMQEQGFFRQICRKIAVLTREQWLAIGVPPEQLYEYDTKQYSADLAPVDIHVCDAVWNGGEYMWELIQARTYRLDYQRRLGLRQVSKDEYVEEESNRKRRERDRRLHPTPRWTGEQTEEFAYSVMCDLLATIAAVAERNEVRG